jgi:diguanylate cyclase (GGDEF)-like protein
LEEKLPEFFEAQVHAGHDLSLAMFDLDNFKGLNDTLGHAAGDELLQFVGELLRTALRSGDVAFRYGGDEFLLVCPGVSADAAANIADRLIRLFTQRAKLLTVQPEVSLSAGVASVRRHRPGSAGEMLKMADEALYRVKETGKRGVAIYEPTQEPVVK